MNATQFSSYYYDYQGHERYLSLSELLRSGYQMFEDEAGVVLMPPDVYPGMRAVTA